MYILYKLFLTKPVCHIHTTEPTPHLGDERACEVTLCMKLVSSSSPSGQSGTTLVLHLPPASSPHQPCLWYHAPTSCWYLQGTGITASGWNHLRRERLLLAWHITKVHGTGCMYGVERRGVGECSSVNYWHSVYYGVHACFTFLSSSTISSYV